MAGAIESNRTMNKRPKDFEVNSPTSVVQHATHVVEPIHLSSKHTDGDDKGWVCPASIKSIRTRNPIRAIVDPIVANVKLGCQRPDGKDPISLAVRFDPRHKNFTVLFAKE